MGVYDVITKPLSPHVDEKLTEYQILDNVADESKEFTVDDLIHIWELESSRGTHPATNKGTYQGHFQLSTAIAKKYGLKPEDRKDLEKSARATLNYAEDNLKNMPNKLNLYKNIGIGKSMVAYLAHQQGRAGVQDIITGMTSGDFKYENTRWKLLNNLGVKVKDNDGNFTEEFKKVNKYFPDNPEGRKRLAHQFLSYWKTQGSIKKVDADNWAKIQQLRMFLPDEAVVDSVLSK